MSYKQTGTIGGIRTPCVPALQRNILAKLNYEVTLLYGITQKSMKG